MLPASVSRINKSELPNVVFIIRIIEMLGLALLNELIF